MGNMFAEKLTLAFSVKVTGGSAEGADPSAAPGWTLASWASGSHLTPLGKWHLSLNCPSCISNHVENDFRTGACRN